MTSAPCDIEGCDRPALYPGDGVHIVRCALHEIASYNEDELVEWGEDNAADMVAAAQQQLEMEAPSHAS